MAEKANLKNNLRTFDDVTEFASFLLHDLRTMRPNLPVTTEKLIRRADTPEFQHPSPDLRNFHRVAKSCRDGSLILITEKTKSIRGFYLGQHFKN